MNTHFLPEMTTHLAAFEILSAEIQAVKAIYTEMKQSVKFRHVISSQYPLYGLPSSVTDEQAGFQLNWDTEPLPHHQGNIYPREKDTGKNLKKGA